MRLSTRAGITATTILALAITSSAHGQQRGMAQERLSFKCAFGAGQVASWDSGKAVVEKAPAMNKPGDTIHFDAIDLNARTARMIGNAGASDLTVVSASPDGLSLLERTPSGNVVVVTIFAWDRLPSGQFPVVMSRHMNMFGPIPSQYFGTCDRW